MRKLGFFNKVVFLCNVIFALLLVVSFVLPYLPPQRFPTLSLLSLGVSPLIVVNIIFVLYWLVQFKRQLWLSAIILVIAFFHFNSFYEISSEVDASKYKNSLRILSFNVRLFNAYEKDQSKDVGKIINTILKTETPDLICIQEYYRSDKIDFSAYPYQYIHFKADREKLGHAIFSKYPLINTGAFDFEFTGNNILYADVVKGNDTLRVYNLHLQSLKIIPTAVLQEEDTGRLRIRISHAFQIQQQQVAQLLKHKEKSKYPVLLCGDFNNTPFSYTYQKVSKGMKDAFVKRGNGLGTTFLFDKYPMRIDFILTDPSFDVLRFKTIRNTFSDHYPITATVGWEGG